MSTLYRTFLKGLLTLLPIALTLYLIAWIATSIEDLFAGPLRTWFVSSLYFPGAGLVLAICLIFMVGLLVNTYLTQRFIDWLEKQLQKLPVIRSIYNPLRDMTHLFANNRASKHEGATAQRVVMVSLEGWGIEVLGLVTRDSFEDLPMGTMHDGCIAVFIPFSYGFGGFTVIVPKDRTRETTIPADKAMQLAITGWIKASK